MPLYDALVHALEQQAPEVSAEIQASLHMEIYIRVIITVFMFLSGVNFSLYYQLLKGNFKGFYKNQEFKFYVSTVLIAILLITLDLNAQGFFSLGESIRYSSFQVSSIITTTGFSTTDFNLWPTFSKIILILLMFIGGSAGSTSGGIKCIRFVLLFKIIKRDILNIIHPKAVHTIKIDGKTVNEDTLAHTMSFFFIYFAVFALSSLFISLDGNDLVTSATSVVATLSNIWSGIPETLVQWVIFIFFLVQQNSAFLLYDRMEDLDPSMLILFLLFI